MADEAKGTEEGKKKKLNLGIDFKMIGIGLGVFIVAIGVTFFAISHMLGSLKPDSEALKPVEIALVEVGDFTTNIADTTNHYVRVQVAISIPEGEEAAATASQFMPVIKDTIISVLSQKPASQLNANNEELKEEIRDNINARLGTRLVEGVFFTNFIMQ
jgi:flagellar FliL protein